MAQFLSGRRTNFNVGVTSVTENTTPLQVIGKVGIGTTTADGRSLYVIGNAEVSGIFTASRIFSSVFGEFTGGNISGTNLVGTALSVSGISTLSSLGVTGLTTTRDLLVTGISTLSSLGVTGLTTTRDLQVTGIATLSSLGVTGLTTTRDLLVTNNLQVNGISTLNTISAGGTTGISQYVLTSTGTGLIWQSAIALTGVTGINVVEDATGGLKYLAMQTGAGTTQTNNISSNQLVYNSTNRTLGIGTTNATSKLTVQGDVLVSGVVTATTFYGNLVGYADRAGIATYANTAGIATYAQTAGIATYAPNAGIASYADRAGIATYAPNAGIATYADRAGIATYANNAGIATYAQTAGIATYATNAGVSTNLLGGAGGSIPYQFSSGITSFLANGSVGQLLQSNGTTNAPSWSSPQGLTIGYANTAGIATFATSAGIATYSTSSGVSTSVIGGIASVTQLNVSGVSTLGITSTTNLTAQQLNVSGISTLGITSVTQLNVSGISTLGITSATNLTAQQLNVSGLSTFSGITTYRASLFGTTASFSGVVTATTFIGNLVGYADRAGISTYADRAGIATYATSAGIATYATSAGIATYATSAGIATYATSAGIATYSTSSGVSTSVIGGIASVTQLNVSGVSTVGLITAISIGIGTTNPTSRLWVDGDGYFTGILTSNRIYSSLYGEFTGTNVTGTNIVGTSLSISGISTLGFVTSFNAYFTGIVTANTFVGNLTGTASKATYATSSGIATNLLGGAGGSIPYQFSSGITSFLANGSVGQLLQSNGTTNAPSWANPQGLSIGYANTAGIATFATSAGISGIATYAINAGIATYATNAGIATYATNAGIATYATSAGIATYSTNAGIATYATSAGIATIAGYASTAGVSTALQFSRNFSITGNFVTATAISFDGTGNVALAATIPLDSIGLGTYTTGDYVKSISGTTNQISVSATSGEGSTPILSLPSNLILPQDVTVTRDLQVNRNLNVSGNITIGGTSAIILAQELKVSDPDLVLGFRTDAFGNDISNDTTSNHGGVALASTEGTPLVNLFIAGIETNPSTYKKIMWFKSGTFSGLGTDAWLINYAVGIGSTQFPSGTRLAAGSVQFTENDLAVVRNINASGIVTASSFVGPLTGNAATATYATSAGIATYADRAGIATYATNAGIATYADRTGIATYATSAGIATYAPNAGISTYADRAGIATYAPNAGISTYADRAGIATYATSAGIATYATNAGISTNLKGGAGGSIPYQTASDTTTFLANGSLGQLLQSNGGTSAPSWSTPSGLSIGYANTAGIATYATSAGIATYATSAGIATIAGYASTAGIATYATSAGIATIAGYASTAGIATYATNAGIATYATSAGIATNVSGGIASVTSLSVSGVSTFSGIATHTTSLFGTNASFTGVVTATQFVGSFSGNVTSATYAQTAGIATYATSAGIATYATNAGISTNLKGGAGGSIPYQTASDSTTFLANGTSGYVLQANGGTNAPTWVPAASSGAITGITIRDEGTTVGTALSVSSVNFVGGNIVATASGVGATITISDNLVGTALSISGISTLGTLQVSSGIVTATVGVITYYGDGSKLTGVSGGGGTSLSISTSVVSQSQYLSFVSGASTSILGISTLSQPLVFTPSTGNLGIGTTNPLQKAHILGSLLVAAGSATTQHITQKAYELNNGTLSWEGTAGQLFSITNNLTSGSIFSVNDVSGIPSIDVDANGTVSMVAYGGNVAIGFTGITGTASQRLQVTGGAYVSGSVGIGTTAPLGSLQVGAGTSTFIVTGIGSVGVGVTNPPYRFTVVSSGATASPSLSNVIADFTANTNSYSQINTRNSSSGANASTDIIATADTGTDTTNYIDLGINNSGYSAVGWTINGALDGYLYTSDTNLSIGAAGANKYVSVFTGGTAAANERLRVTGIGSVGIGTTNPTSTLHVIGTTELTGVLETVSVGNTIGIAGTNRVILECDALKSTVFTHNLTNGPVGIVSFKNIPSNKNSATTFTVLFTQNATGTANISTSTGIGTNVFLSPQGVTGFTTTSKFAAGSIITISSTALDVDIVSFLVHYNGSGSGTASNYKVYATNNSGFR